MLLKNNKKLRKRVTLLQVRDLFLMIWNMTTLKRKPQVSLLENLKENMS